MELRFSHGGSSLGYFKGVKKFSDGVKDFLKKLRFFSSEGLRLFHDG